MTDFAASTHPGLKRDHNEDSFEANAELNLWLVADGVGGHSFGEVASTIARDTIKEEFSHGKPLLETLYTAHAKVLDEIASRNISAGDGMGTTIVAMALNGDAYDIAWVGDSRAYLWDGKILSQITQDHTYVRNLVAQGVISREEAKQHPERNVLTQSMGVSPEMPFQPDSVQGVLKLGQQILLCSDGLNDELSRTEIEAQMRQQHSVQGQVDGLINAALAAGGGDNVTVVIVGASVSGTGDSEGGMPDAETTQNIGVAVRSQIEVREEKNHKLWLFVLLAFALSAFIAWLY